MIAPRPPRPRRVEPGADDELRSILGFARDREAAQRARLAAAGLAVAVAPRRTAGGPTGAAAAAIASDPGVAARPAVDPAAASRAPGTLIARVDVSPSVALFRIARPAGLAFEAGQAIKVGVGGVRRSYTIASAPGDPVLELCIERVPGGALTSRLFALAPGAKLDVVDRAKGDLLFDAAASAHLMVATVTGIAPFMSMLRHVLPRAPNTRVIVVHGARAAEDLVYRAELEALAARHPGLEVRHAVTQPAAGWTGRVGRVTEHLDDALRTLAGAGRVTTYACGHPDMVRDASAHFAGLGLPVRTEEFFT